MTFVDTSIWYASVMPDDPGHAAADRVLSEYAGTLVTTDYILDETLTLLRARRLKPHALALGPVLLFEKRTGMVYVTREDIAEAWRIFRDYSDKEWSFTDCTCKAVMKRLGIETALSLDGHFRQFGNINVLP